MLIFAFIFVPEQDRSHQLEPYLLVLTLTAQPAKAISDLSAPPGPQPRRNGLGAMSRSGTLCPNKANLLYFD